MKNRIFSALLVSLLAPSLAAANNQYYAEVDVGTNQSLLHGYTQVRAGLGLHKFFTPEPSGWLVGVDTHASTNISKFEDINFFADSTYYPALTFYSVEANGLVGYQWQNAIELTFKLGAIYNNNSNYHESVAVPQAGLNLAIPVSERVKITTEIDYQLIGISAQIGLRYVFL